VVVVGGGPAGSSAAISLARAGRDVVLVDRARFPRDKCCGDGLTAAALRMLEELGLEPGRVASWQHVDDIWVRSPSGRTVRFPLPRGQGTYAAIARRADLDAALLDVARDAGVDVRDSHALTDARDAGAAVELDVDGLGTLRAAYAIGADGAWSPLRKALGAGEARYLGDWHAFRQYFSGVSDTARDIWVWFEPDVLPGYAWSFPLPGGRANVGFGIVREEDTPVGHMKQLWPDILARPQIRDVLGPAATPEAPHRAWPIPARVDRVRLAAGRALFVGDAAAATDPMTGEGIAQALVTGRLAAEAILRSGSVGPAAVARDYEAGVRRELVADHRMSALLTHATRHRKGVRTAIRVAGASDWTRRNFARWLFEDYPRAAIVTPRRWRRGVFTGPGAYRAA